MAALRAILQQFRLNGESLEKLERAQAERKLGSSLRADEARAESEAPSDPHAQLSGFQIGCTLAQLLRRPEIIIEDLLPILHEALPDFFLARTPRACSVADRSTPVKADVLLPAFAPRDRGAASPEVEKPPNALMSAAVRAESKSVETEIKYAGTQPTGKAIERLKKAEQRAIPEWFDYASVSGLSREMKEKLQRVRPRTNWAGIPDSRSHPRGRFPGECVHRNPGAATNRIGLALRTAFPSPTGLLPDP